ncbi:SDR family oxidoreductase [Alteromonas gracilis]
MHITLIGGHGKVALQTSPLLSQAGHEVVGVIRNPDHADEVRAAGATPEVRDIESLDAAGWADLLRGTDVVVWSAGAGGGSPERTYAVDRDAAIASIDAAAEVGVPRYVMVSYFGAGPDHGVPESEGFYAYAEAKAAADAHLRDSSLAWTVLGPSALTDDEATGRVHVTSDREEGLGKVSRGNVAHVVAHVVEHPHDRETIEFHDGDTPITEL